MTELIRPLLSWHPGWLAVFAAIGLTVIGILAIDTATTRPVEVDPIRMVDAEVSGDAAIVWTHTLMKKQMVFLPIALVAMVIAAIPHHRKIAIWSYPIMLVSLVMLVIILIPFMPRSVVPVINGARRWFDLQVILFQPSEVAKIAFVLALAYYLRYRENYRTFKGLLIPLCLSFIPMALILVEPDLGTSLIFLPVFFAMLIVAGARLKHIIAIITIGLLLCPAMYPIMKPHQKDRVNAMFAQLIGDTSHRDDIGFQGYKAQTLVGAGAVMGHEPRHATDLIRFNALPESHNDMIFAVICTRWGMLGGMTVILLYFTLIVSGLLTAAINRDPFARLVSVGLVTIIFTQMTVNIGMTIGLLPITGMTLPFISYGGSSLVSSFITVGLLFNVAARQRVPMARATFEFDRRSRADRGTIIEAA